MADLPLNNKLKDPTQNPSVSPIASGGGEMGNAATTPLSNSSSSSIVSSGPVSTAGVGAGGTGGWTPIQAYLKANQGSTGTATALEREAGSALGADKSRIESQASEAKSGMQAAQGQKIATDQASQIINQYTQGQNNGVGQIKNYLGASYQAKPVDLSLSADSQAYGKGATGDQQGFQGMLNRIYQKESGGRMGAGQNALQTQLDQDNSALHAAKANVGAQYKGLNQMIGGEDGNSGLLALNKEMGQFQNDFSNGQNEIKNTLNTDARDAEASYNYAQGWDPSVNDKTSGAGGFRDATTQRETQNAAATKYNAIMEALGRSERKAMVQVPTIEPEAGRSPFFNGSTAVGPTKQQQESAASREAKENSERIRKERADRQLMNSLLGNRR